VKCSFITNLQDINYLDVIGDLALIGMPIKGHIITKKPGHKLNTSFAKILKKAMKEQEKT
jgi:UDP-3-O-[3-hydroxymyristoyl] N-acetylglucosamine deacetylase/3-hydroxyacyl-[acyl-carrier-protein] dehydratase